VDEKIRMKKALRATRTAAAVNALLFALKLSAGILAGSFALITDAVDSAADVLATGIAAAGVRIGGKKEDANHPYGHERIEYVAATALALLLILTGAVFAYAAAERVIDGSYKTAVPGIFALIAAGVSAAAKEALCIYAFAAAKKLKSPAIKAAARNYQGDVFSSLGSFAAVLGSRLGAPILDPIVSALICILVFRSAVVILIDAAKKMTDVSVDDATRADYIELILSCPNVLGIDALKTRMFGERVYVDAEISLSAELTFVQAHEAAEYVHRALEERFPPIKHCTVHANPQNSGGLPKSLI
jgi:cation diffusion facilitator family transporter